MGNAGDVFVQGIAPSWAAAEDQPYGAQQQQLREETIGHRQGLFGRLYNVGG